MEKNGEKIRVVLVEDHTVVREGLRALLGGQADIDVVGEAEDGETAVREAVARSPDVIVMDLFLKGLNGIEAIERISKRAKGSRILVLSMYGNEDYVVSALRAGASGYILKGSGISRVVEAIRLLKAGGTCFPPDVETKIAGKGTRSAHSRLDLLTEREKEVLQLIAEGRTSPMIAGALGISVKTAETHRTNIMTKLDIHNTAGLVRFAVRMGLVQPE